MKFVSAAHLTGGGTITGDLTISGDLTVTGGGGFDYSEVITGDVQITNNNQCLVLSAAAGGSSNHTFMSFHSDGGDSLGFSMGHYATDNSFMISGAANNLNTPRFYISSDGKVGIGTIVPTRGLHIINSAIVKGKAIFELTGDINPVNNSTTVTGTSTLFLSEVSIGDTITVTGETKTVTAIASDTSLTIDTTFSSGLATDTTPQATPAAFTVLKNDATLAMRIDSAGVLDVNNNGTQLAGNLNYNIVSRHSSYARGVALGYDGGAAAGFISAWGASSDLIFATHNGTAYGERMRLDHDGSLGIGIINPMNSLSVSPSSYSTGTASQSGTTVTGGSTVWTAAMIGREVVYADGTSSGLITARASNTSITVTTSQTVSSQAYNIHYIGLQVGSDGQVGIGITDQDQALEVGDAGKIKISGSIASSYTGRTLILESNTQQIITASNDLDIIANGLIQFQPAGAIRFVLDTNSRISLSNNDGNTSNTVFGKTAFTNAAGAVLGNVGADWNTVIGEEAMGGADTLISTDNVAVGYHSLRLLISGDSNTSIGSTALRVMASGSHNTGVGQNAIKASTAGSYMTVIGSNALYDTVDWSNDGTVAIGYKAGFRKNGSGGQYTAASVHIGYHSGYQLQAGTGNTSVGHQTLGGNESGVGISGSNNTVVGYTAGYAMQGASASNTYIGSKSGEVMTVDIDNTIIGSEAASLMYGASNVAVGKDALKGETFTNATCDYNHTGGSPRVVGHDADASIIAGLGVKGTGIPDGAYIQNRDNSTQFTISADATATATDGTLTFYSRSTGSVTMGTGAGKFVATTDNSTFIGYQAGQGVTGDGNVLTGNNNTAVGKDAGLLLQGAAHSNAIFGSGAGSALTNGDSNTIIGEDAGKGSSGFYQCTYVGNGAGGAGTGNFQTALGLGALSGGHSGAGYNVAIGISAMAGATTGTYNIAIGANALDAATDGDHNIAIGKGSMGNSNSANNGNICIGEDSGDAFGTAAVSGTVLIGKNAGGGINHSGSNYTVAIGQSSLISANSAAAVANTAVGYQSGNTITTGLNNTLIGYNVDVSASGANNQSVIGHDTTGVADHSVTLGNANVTAVYMASDSGAAVHCAKVNSGTATGTAAGGGIDAVSPTISVGTFNSEIMTTIFIDIGAGSIVSSAHAGDVIGEDGVANAYVTRITTAINGLVYKGEIICLEVPTTGDPDINVCANASGTIAEDAAGEGEHILADAGVQTLGLPYRFTLPAGSIVNDYIYLTHGGTTAGTYDAGKFLIRFWGASVTGL